MRWRRVLWAQYDLAQLRPDPLPLPDGPLPSPPADLPLRACDCGHAYFAYATCPRTGLTQCLPCHQRHLQGSKP